MTHAPSNLGERIDTAILDRMRVTDAQITRWFEHHVPDAEQEESIRRIKAACAACCQIIKDAVPGSPDQTAALRHVREASMTAVQAVLRRGR